MMKVENKFEYRLTDRLGTIAVVPLGENDFSIEWSRSDSEDQFEFEKRLSGNIIFVAEGFKRLMHFEKTMYRCEQQKLELFHVCNGVEKVFFSGSISLNEAEFNLDKCQISIKFSKDSKNDCFDFNKGEKANVFQLVQDRKKAKLTVIGGGVFEFKECRYINTHWTTGDPTFFEYWCEAGEPSDGNWFVKKNYEEMSGMTNDDGVDNIYQSFTTWVREVVEMQCGFIAPPEWILIESNCDTTGKNKYAKPPSLFNCTSNNVFIDQNNYVYARECRVMGSEDDGVKEIDNGFLLNSVLIELVKLACPNLTVKSEFFQINPDVVTSINYVTEAPSTTNEILMFQKSDVKRPNTTNNATKLELTAEKLLEILFKVFNVKWRIEGNEFRIEHVSYFSRNQGINVLANPKLNQFFLNQYLYQNDKIPKREIFKFKEQRLSQWIGEIEYTECVAKGKNTEETILVDEMTTDLQFVLDNPEADSKNVEDSGFVLMSTTKSGGEYYVNTVSTTMGSALNSAFSWDVLIRDFIGYERPMKKANVNGVPTVFHSSKPIKKGQTFAIPFPLCQSEFAPDDTVLTALGEGVVDAATFRFKDCFIELSLLYQADEGLVVNNPPTLSGGGVYSTAMNQAVQMPFTATDGDGTIDRMEVVSQLLNGGSVTFQPDAVTFTPETGFVGAVAFSIAAFDNYNERSNVINFAVNVTN